MNSKSYTQVELTKNNSYYTVYIPTYLAMVGKMVKVKEKCIVPWFKWKFWRFALAENIEVYRIYGVDEDGGWVRLCGTLWWLKSPRR